ncbi:MAG: Fe-S cluster assembly protein IscX [Burkholderiales bacterium]|jgi:FeS assembly protein IscX|nr:Fe-S cluster assembly protein IscX [Burkholderiales bacterium]
MTTQKLSWRDALAIAERLAEEHADVDPRFIRFTDLHRFVCELDDFEDRPDASNELLLEAIQMAWIDEVS